MTKGIKFSAALLAAALAGATVAYAATSTETSGNSGAMAAQANMNALGISAPRTQGDVTFISGGVGQDSIRAMHAMAHKYDLRLMFAVKGSGEYLANVRVKLESPKGKTIVDAMSEGPYFYAKVPPGKYQVVAESEGRTMTRSVDITHGRAVSQPFYWSAAS